MVPFFSSSSWFPTLELNCRCQDFLKFFHLLKQKLESCVASLNTPHEIHHQVPLLLSSEHIHNWNTYCNFRCAHSGPVGHHWSSGYYNGPLNTYPFFTVSTCLLSTHQPEYNSNFARPYKPLQTLQSLFCVRWEAVGWFWGEMGHYKQPLCCALNSSCNRPLQGLVSKPPALGTLFLCIWAGLAPSAM